MIEIRSIFGVFYLDPNTKFQTLYMMHHYVVSTIMSIFGHETVEGLSVSHEDDECQQKSQSIQTSSHSDLELSDHEEDMQSQLSHHDESIVIDQDYKCCRAADQTQVEHKGHFSETYFDHGKFRYAYKGNYCGKDNEKPHGQVCVVKKWKREHIYDNTFWDRDLRIATLANKLAQKWNKKFKQLRKIRVLQPTEVRCCTVRRKQSTVTSSDKVAYGEKLLVEDFLAGDFVKWNSNSRWIQHENSIIQAFCHWTYHYSNANILLCDAQGIKTSSCILYLFCYNTAAYFEIACILTVIWL